ncbi:MAG TPA: DUF481 domain-containing protein [Puia sp.]|jgi:hypothetical protein|nr:DUF481 domain-containing protein [Puia sp.]
MIRISLITVVSICFFSFKSFSQNKDTIVLYNGQELIGTIQSANLGAITIDDIDLKMLSVKLFKIKVLIVHERFKIETVDKHFFYGTMGTSDKTGWVDINLSDSSKIPLHITQIFQLISLEDNFFRRLNGNVSAGLSFTKSSNIGQLNFSANVQYATRLINYQLTLSSIGSIDSGKYSRDNENVQLYAAYDLNTSWFLAVAAQYQRNLELSISRRYLGITGVGNKLFIEKTWRLLLISGLSYSQEKSSEGVSSGLLLEIPVVFQFNFYKFRNPDIQISSNQTVYFGVTQSGRIRYDASTTFSWQLIRYFYLNISPYANSDNRPPAGSLSTFDYGIVVGLSYKF